MNKRKSAFFERDIKNNKRTQTTFSPCVALKPIIKGYMMIECGNGINLETLPNTSVSINYIINGNVGLKEDGGTITDLPNAVAFGIARTTKSFTFSDNTTLLVVILKEGTASCVIKKNVHELFDQFIDLNDLFHKEEISSLNGQLKEQTTYKGLVQTIERFFLSVTDFIPIDPVIDQALIQIRKKRGLISIRTLTSELSVSKDAFEKKFRSIVGTTPKHYANIIRFRNLIHRSYPDKKLTTIGLDAGYYDQSHFIRNFKLFTGKRPSNFF